MANPESLNNTVSFRLVDNYVTRIADLKGSEAQVIKHLPAYIQQVQEDIAKDSKKVGVRDALPIGNTNRERLSHMLGYVFFEEIIRDKENQGLEGAELYKAMGSILTDKNQTAAVILADAQLAEDVNNAHARLAHA